MSASAYVVLSFDVGARDDFLNRSEREFPALTDAMMHGAAELARRDGVLILRCGKRGRKSLTVAVVAACGAAEDGIVALMASATFESGDWSPRVGAEPRRELALAH